MPMARGPKRKLDNRAYTYWVGLGPDRCHQMVADRFEVSLRTVSRYAAAEDWNGRLRQAEERAKTGETTIEDPAALVNALDRQQRVFQEWQVRADKFIKAQGFSSVSEALKAMDIAARAERELLKIPPHRAPELTKAQRDRQALEALTGAEEWDEGEGPGDDE